MNVLTPSNCFKKPALLAILQDGIADAYLPFPVGIINKLLAMCFCGCEASWCCAFA